MTYTSCNRPSRWINPTSAKQQAIEKVGDKEGASRPVIKKYVARLHGYTRSRRGEAAGVGRRDLRRPLFAEPSRSSRGWGGARGWMDYNSRSLRSIPADAPLLLPSLRRRRGISPFLPSSRSSLLCFSSQLLPHLTSYTSPLSPRHSQHYQVPPQDLQAHRRQRLQLPHLRRHPTWIRPRRL